MKDDTKKVLTIAAVGGIGLYLLTRPKGDAATGGFGGGGGIPLLPGDAAEDDESTGDTIINYILPKPEHMPDWAKFDTNGDTKKADVLPPDVEVRAMSLPTMVEEATTAETAFLGMATTAVEHPMSLPYTETGRDVRILGDIVADRASAESRPWYAPWTWDWKAAAENYQKWSSASTARTLGTDTNLQSGASSVSATTRSAVTTQTADKVRTIVSKKSMYTGGFDAAGGYSRVRMSKDNIRGVPGWKQVGAKKPTAPGQPDRY